MKSRIFTPARATASAFVVSALAFATHGAAFSGSSKPPDDPACGATCCFVVPPMDTSGDLFYGSSSWDWCRQGFLNNHVDGYGMSKSHWDQGFGWEAACDMERPFGRQVAARVALQMAPVNPRSNTEDWSGSILQWAFGWSWERVDDLRADCSNGRSDATRSGDTITLHLLGRPNDDGSKRMGYFHRLNVPSRSALLLHEARHFNFGSHDGANQRDSSWNVNGPYRYQAVWLMDYAANANRDTSTQALRCAAQDSAINIMYGNRTSAMTTGDGWAFVTAPDPSLRPDNVECR